MKKILPLLAILANFSAFSQVKSSGWNTDYKSPVPDPAVPHAGKIIKVDAAGNYFLAPDASNDSTTATNGLNLAGKNVKLGGPLTEATTITTDAANTLSVNSLAGATAPVFSESNTAGTKKYYQGNGSPNGVVTPFSIGCEYTDLTTGDYYRSSGTTNTSWTGYFGSNLTGLTTVNKTRYTNAAGTVENGGKTFTVPTSGKYLFYGWFSTVTVGLNTNTFSIRNGTTVLATDNQQAYNNTIHSAHFHVIEVDLVAGVTYNAFRSGATMDANDYLTVMYRQLSVSSVTVIPAGTVTAVNLHSAKLRRATAQTIPNNAATAIQFTAQDDNPQGIGVFGVDDAIVIAQSGKYNVHFRGGFDGAAGLTATTPVIWNILKNGVAIATAQDNGGIANVNYVEGVTAMNLSLVAGDVLKFTIFQLSTAARNTSTILSTQPTVEIMQQSTGVTALVAPLHTYLGTASNPITTPPTGSPADGDTYIQTTDGTSAGELQSSWTYSSTASTWILTGSKATTLASSPSFRTYYPTTTAFEEKWATVRTAPQVAAMGFTGVGGATITPYGPAYFGHFMLSASATRAITPTTNFTVPTSYIRHELAITNGKENTYFISTLGDRETCLEVWVCDPVTGVPVKRLAANGTSSIAAGRIQGNQLSPKNEAGNSSSYYQWVGFPIPSAIVSTYKTGTNTIKLALRPANGNGETNLWYITGYAMAQSDFGVTVSGLMNFDNWLNEDAATAAKQWAYSGMHEGRAYGAMGANTTFTVRVPVSDITKDIILNCVGNAQSTVGISEMAYSTFTIKHTSGDVVLGRMQPAIESPLAKATMTYGHRASGWLIPASTLATKTVLPTNSAVSYLEIQMVQHPSFSSVGSGFVVENAN